MNNRILLSVFTLAFIYVLSSCGDHSHDNGGHQSSGESQEVHDHDHEHDHDEGGHSHDHDHEGDHDHDHDAPDQSGKEFTSAYVCPMHCEGSGSDEPGQCPVCEMDYKENPDAKVDDTGDTSAPV